MTGPPHAGGSSRAPSSVVVIGTGLVGTSLGLALRRHGVSVHLRDAEPEAAVAAARLGAGVTDPPPDPADLAVIAVPPAAVAAVLLDAQRRGLARAYTDTASVKAAPQRQAEDMGCDPVTYVGGHPMAGGEGSGPAAARGDLFDGRPWVLTPSVHTGRQVLDMTLGMVGLSGALPLVSTPEGHDAAVARASHAPQVVASLLAGLLADADTLTLAVAGQGLRDTVRIAASPTPLWLDILTSNAEAVHDVLGELADRLNRTVDALGSVAVGPTGSPTPPAALDETLRRGRTGHARLPGKHGTRDRLTGIAVVVPDEPGQLARLLADAAEAEVNVEDLTIDHAPGQPVGLVVLAVAPASAGRLAEQLSARGWSARPTG